MSEQWGPWIEHDGCGCPCVGKFVEFEYKNGNRYQAIAEDGPWWRGGGRKSWKGTRENWAPITRYRISKPRGLTILESILREVEDHPSANSPASAM